MTTTERGILLDTARLYVAKWVPRMRLAAWSITVVEDPPEEGVLGQVVPTLERRIARIRIGAAHDDLEHTVVHELLHLVLWAYGERTRGRVGGLLYEQDVDLLATVLVECDRREPTS